MAICPRTPPSRMTASSASCRSVHLFKHRSKAVSGLQWTQIVPRKPYTLFLQFLSEFA